MRGSLLIALMLLVALAWADSPTRAKQHYQLHCMGCHGEDGAGLEGQVPSLRGTLSRISKGELGRDYVLRVPGVTQSSLSSEELAEVLNWAIREFSDAEAAETTVGPLVAIDIGWKLGDLNTLNGDAITLTVSPGTTFEMTSEGAAEHDFVVDELGVNVPVGPGETVEVTIPADAAPGRPRRARERSARPRRCSSSASSR